MSSDTPEQTVLQAPQPAPPAPDPADTLPGMKLGDYVVEQAIGWGGMGIVYRAVHPLIGRKVAVKVLRPNFASDPEQASRFLKEAQAISAIKHRGIIDIISFGNLPDGRQYMVMEYLDGETLEAVMARDGALTPARALPLIEEVLDALSAAHRVGVVHRDLKPANVYIAADSNGARSVKLVDFGLARRAKLDDLNRASGKASLMAGTPEYISPEQARGLTATPRTDLYCLGVMLFEMVTGRLPFTADSVIELLGAHLSKLPPRASTLANNLPAGLDDLIDQLLKKQPEDRPQSAERVKQAVVRLARELRDSETQIHGTASGSRPALRSNRSLNPVQVATPPVDEKTAASLPPTDRFPVVRSDTEELAVPAKVGFDTEPRLDHLGLPKWVWPVAGAGVLLALAGVWVARQPVDNSTVVELQEEVPQVVALAPAAAVTESPPRLPVVPVQADEEPVALPKHRRVEPPKPRPAAPVAAAPKQELPLPPVCEGANWQETMHRALDKLEQPALAKGIDVAPLDGFHAQIKGAKSKADCAAISARVSAWRKKVGVQVE